MTNHQGRLILTPSDPHACPDRGRLLATLSQIAFIGAPIGERGDTFLIGPDFLELVAFTGCAVAVASDPGGGGTFCHVRVPPPASRPLLLHGRNTRPPRCPGCRGRLISWHAQMKEWEQAPEVGFTCARCGQTCPPWHWDWKRQGGLGRQLIVVEGVFPGEASPAAALLDALDRTGPSGWQYFYVQD